MDRRTFVKVAALAPAALSGGIVGAAAAASSPVDAEQAYPVTYGPIACFNRPEICGCGWSNHQAQGPLALKGSYFGMTVPAQPCS